MARRRRIGEGTVHPTVIGGRVVGWRGLASYTDPQSGRRRRRSVSRRTREATEHALRELTLTLPRCPPPPSPPRRPLALPPDPPPGSLHALVQRWLEATADGVRPSTYRQYVQQLGPVVGVLGNRPVTALQPADIEAAVARLTAAHSRGQAARMLARLRAVLRQAVRWGVIPHSPAQDVTAPRGHRPERPVWSGPEAARFLAACGDHRLTPLFVLALSTGLRCGELLALRWSDVDLGTAVLTVTRTRTRDAAGRAVDGPPKTPASRRRLPLAPDVVAALRAHRPPRPSPDAPVFATASGRPLDAQNLRRDFLALQARASVPRLRLHDLRHTAASLLVRHGVPPRLVADRLGHRDVAFTLSLYTHVYDDQRVQAALPLNRLLGGGPAPLPDAATWTRGLTALRELHRALGAFLEGAPAWALAALEGGALAGAADGDPSAGPG